MALPNLSSARSPTIRRGLGGASDLSKPYPLCNMAPHRRPHQSSARIPLRLHAVVDLDAAPWEPGSVAQCRFSRFVALWIFGFAALGQTKRAGSASRETPTQPNCRRVKSIRVDNSSSSVQVSSMSDEQTWSLQLIPLAKGGRGV
jgi:hypothetical protein